MNSVQYGGALDWITSQAEHRQAAGLRRSLTVRGGSSTDAAVDLAGNDYLGLSTHPEVIDGGVAALRTWGAGSTGSRLVTGNTALHEAFEANLADFMGWPAALVFSSGYLANIGAVTALSGRDSLVVSDGGSHASLIDACRLSRARVVVTPRGDVAAVRAALVGRAERRAVILSDAVYSIDGAVAPIAELYRAARDSGAALIVDEAHGLGVCGDGGRGAVQQAGLAGADDLIVTATMSKSLGAQGGVVLSSPAVRAHLIDSARTFIFDTALAPAAVGAAAAALQVLRRSPELPAAVARNGARIAAAIGEPPPVAAVVSHVIGAPHTALNAAQWCAQHGVHVGCFRPPSVPEGTSRLRMTTPAALTADELDHASGVLTAVAARAQRHRERQVAAR